MDDLFITFVLVVMTLLAALVLDISGHVTASWAVFVAVFIALWQVLIGDD